MLTIKKNISIITAVLTMIVSIQALAKCELDRGYKLPEGVTFNSEGYLDGNCRFIEGLAVVSKEGKYGFVNKKGQVIIPITYALASINSDGFAVVMSKTNKVTASMVDMQAQKVGSIEYDDLKDPTEGLLAVAKANKWGFVNNQGKEVVPLEYDAVAPFSEGLALVKKDGQWGGVDKYGEIIIPLEYDNISSFSEELAVVKKDKKYGFINKQGKVAIPLEYDEARSFSEGLAKVMKISNVKVYFNRLNVKKTYDAKYGYINKQGEYAVPLDYDDIANFSEGLAAVKKEDKWGFVNKQGEVVIPLEYDAASSFSERLARVAKNGKYGFVDTQGKIAIPFEYDYAISSFQEGLVVVLKNDEKFQINKQGQRVD